MKKYVVPTVIEYGDSSNLIKGECGFGNENAWLDKTGSHKYYRYTLVVNGAGNLVCSRVPYCDYTKTLTDACTP